MFTRPALHLGAALLVAGMLCTAATARQVTVKLKGGQEISGELLSESAQSLTIRTETGAEIRIGRDRLAGPIRERMSLEEMYRQRRSRIAEGDIGARLELARWLHENKSPSEQKQAWTLALEELDAILKAEPGSQEARFMRDAVAANLRKIAGDKPAPPGEPPTSDNGAVPSDPKPLTAEQITRMKVLELDLSARPKVVVPEKVVQEFLEKYTRDPVDPAMERFLGREGERVFKRLEGYEQLAAMFDMRAREFYDRVLVRDEPETLRQFRLNFHTQYVLKHCGTCHATGRATGLTMLRGTPGNEATAYTNLVLLARQEHAGLPLISRDTPERSPLLQLGLPQSESAIPHPDAQGWRPYFRSRDDQRYLDMVEWIRSLYTDPRNLVEDLDGGAAAGG